MRSFIRALGVAATLAVLSLSATAARAEIVFSNLSAGDVGSVLINTGTGFGIRFTTGTSSLDQRTVQSIQLRLSAATGTASPVLSLFDVSGSNPGSLVASFTGPTVASSVSTTYSFTPTSALTLAANTSYFAVLDASTSTNLSWITMNTEAELQNGSDYLYEAVKRTTTGGASWTTTGASPASTASLEITAVPEPSTIVMACIGVTGAVALDAKRRRRRRATVESEEASA